MKNLESKIVEVCSVVRSLMPHTDLSGACLYYAVAAHRLMGVPIIAGSYSWQYTSLDDGKNATHFSCIFDETAQHRALEILREPDRILDLAHLPEMHVFNVLDGKVLDLSTAWVPELARRTTGFEFESALVPPPYLWGKPVDQYQRWVYDPSKLATVLARTVADKVLPELKVVGL